MSTNRIGHVIHQPDIVGVIDFDHVRVQKMRFEKLHSWVAVAVFAHTGTSEWVVRAPHANHVAGWIKYLGRKQWRRQQWSKKSALSAHKNAVKIVITITVVSFTNYTMTQTK